MTETPTKEHRRCALCAHAKVIEQPVMIVCTQNCVRHSVVDKCVFSKKHQKKYLIGFKSRMYQDIERKQKMLQASAGRKRKEK